jgi:hypothetical protein
MHTALQKGKTMIRKHSILYHLITLLTLYLGGSGVVPVSAAEVGAKAQRPHFKRIINPATPPGGVERLELTEQWRRGGADGDVFFGQLTDVLTDNEGNVYLLDTQLSQVHIYSPEGQLLRTIFSEGEGPGEVRQPKDILLLPDGRIGALHEFPGSIITVTPDGTPGEVIQLRGESGATNIGVFTGRCRDGQLILACMTNHVEMGYEDRKTFLASYDLSGTEQHRFINRHTSQNYNNFVFNERNSMVEFMFRMDLSPRGELYIAPRWDEYVIEVYDRDGNLGRVIEREWKPLTRSRQEISRIDKLINMALERDFPFDFSVEVADTEPAIVLWQQRGLQIRDDGTLWVLTSRGIQDQPAGVMQTYDLFNREGEFEKQVAIACEGNGKRDSLFFTGPRSAILIKGYLDALSAALGAPGASLLPGEEPIPMEVVYYRW